MRTADDEFMEAVEACTLPNAAFHHRNHLRLAWIYVCRFGYEAGSERMAASIRRYAAHQGATEKYHETVTRAWMDLVQDAVARANLLASFDTFLSAHPKRPRRSRRSESPRRLLLQREAGELSRPAGMGAARFAKPAFQARHVKWFFP
jgi:hypothetical protein